MKKSQKKIKKIVLIVIFSLLLLPFVAYGVLWVTVPTVRSDEASYSYFYRRVPVGTSWDEVLEIIDDKGWRITDLDTEHGICIYDGGTVRYATKQELEWHAEEPSESRIVGVKSMRVELGEPKFVMPHFLYITFDEDDKLIEIVIYCSGV